LNQGTKQRIVGTVVLLALALIFLPIIFDGQGSYQSSISSRIPDPPPITLLPEPVQTRPVIVADTLTEESALIESVESAEAESPTVSQAADSGVEVTTSEPVFSRAIPTLNSAGLPQGWSVRLGSFSNTANANNLMARLHAAGYKAYTRGMVREQDTLTGVFVGPWLDRGLVDGYKQRLQEEFNLAGIVVSYELESL